MIRKNDILVYAECLEEGDDRCLMIALEDECTPAEVPMVVVGHLQEGEDSIAVVKKYLPQNKWLYTDALWKENFK